MTVVSRKNLKSVVIVLFGVVLAFVIKVVFLEGKPNRSLTDVKVKEQMIDLGRLRLGEEAIATFEIANVGSNILQITETKPDCNCTVPEISSNYAAKGNSIFIQAKFMKSDSWSGHFQQNILVYCNIEEEFLVLTIRGFIDS